MKSRWGLESNIFPDMFLISLYMIITSLNNGKIKGYYIGIGILSLSVYSYGTSYMFLPIFLIIMLIYLLKTKRINIKNAIISVVIAGIIALPMMIFVIINTFDLEEVKLGIFTIPRMYVNRYQSETTMFSDNFMQMAGKTFIDNIKVILLQKDGLIYNALPFFGTMYMISWPFAILGLITSIKNKKMEIRLLHIWFITSILLYFAMSDPNINRLNICIMPLVMYTILGIHYITDKSKEMILPIIIMYVILFGMFLLKYTEFMSKDETPFTAYLQEAMEYMSNLDVSNIYIERSFEQPYIYALFYTKTPTKEYRDTVEYNSDYQYTSFEVINSFGKYHFYIPDIMEKDSVYLVNSDYYYDRLNFKEKNFGRFKVIEHR